MIKMYLRRLSFILLSGYVAIAVLTSIVAYWPPLTALAPIWYPLLFFPKWWAPVLFFLALPGALLYRKKGLLLLGGVGWVQLITFGGFEYNFSPKTGNSTDGIRVATFNMGTRQLDLSELSHWVSENNLDLVFLQEVVREQKIENIFPSDWFIAREDQMAIASRLPIQLVAASTRSRMDGEYGLRFVSYEMLYGSRTIRLINVHLMTPRSALEPFLAKDIDLDSIHANFRRRDYEANLLAEHSLEEPLTIIAGDFNMPINSPLYRRYFSRFQNAFSVSGFGFGSTKFTSYYGVRIDHVLATDKFFFVLADVGENFGSDHRPVSAQLELH